MYSSLKSATVRDVVKTWAETFESQSENIKALENSVKSKGRAGNKNCMSTRILDTLETHVLIRDFVRELRMNRENVAARDVFYMLLEKTSTIL